MPSTIRETLSERVRTLPDLLQFLRDFQQATGIPVHFASPLGNRPLGAEICTLCRYVSSHPEGARHCNSFLQRLLESASVRPSSATCDAGLVESAVPLRTGGQTFGFLVFGHCASGPLNRTSLNRARHLLSRVGIQLQAEQLGVLAHDAPVATTERLAALERLVVMAAERLVLEITQHIVHPPAAMPPLVDRACRLVRGGFTQPIGLPEIARTLGVSVGHLSRIFHQNTGMRFVEYVARVRAGHARELLGSSDRQITEIAYASGFQSLAQFNRVMRTQYGCAPRQLRGGTSTADAAKLARSTEAGAV